MRLAGQRLCRLDLVESSFETDLEGENSVSDKIETIPEKTRWEIATKGLTGAYIAISNALQQAVGQNQFEEFNGSSGMKQEREQRNLLIPSD